MLNKITVKQAVIVEGLHDKAKLENIIDGVIIPTNGFQIFKDPNNLSLILKYAEKTGVIILTDADDAGLQIRNFLKDRLIGFDIYHMYVPYKEVEMTSDGILRDLFAEVETQRDSKTEITLLRLFEDGFIGATGSRSKRKELLRKLSVPENLSTTALLHLLNVYGLEYYERVIK